VLEVLLGSFFSFSAGLPLVPSPRLGGPPSFPRQRRAALFIPVFGPGSLLLVTFTAFFFFCRFVPPFAPPGPGSKKPPPGLFFFGPATPTFRADSWRGSQAAAFPPPRQAAFDGRPTLGTELPHLFFFAPDAHSHSSFSGPSRRKRGLTERPSRVSLLFSRASGPS